MINFLEIKTILEEESSKNPSNEGIRQVLLMTNEEDVEYTPARSCSMDRKHFHAIWTRRRKSFVKTENWIVGLDESLKMLSEGINQIGMSTIRSKGQVALILLDEHKHVAACFCYKPIQKVNQ